MSNKLMDTEAGGEQTQYEGIHTYVEPHDKKYGQFSDSSEGTSVHTKTADPGAPNTHGITPADKIRYGQSIQEGGMGGKTTSSSGETKAETGFGGTAALSDDNESAAKQRREQGYGGSKDMDRTIGA
ncbi:hypothetical protein ACJQWK_11336 [Exserohilum turcicum]|uniref:Uncharacterized protein n=1 Tax=Exserohilum turcicum (strain 28A) TaxID=671987 RepID=R0KTH6_EXST2|nr:uncharacterized protein SETTUDRAFT_101203 [Exserohilum turcica Et28A]EOA91072.1 hypothetical protein SETTUDRAFT_101203 [Exserohilum turcica Et28A]